MKRITQKQAIFYQLYNHFKEGKTDLIPVFKFMGEVYCKELGKWGFVSYEVAARMSEIWNENPGLLKRREVEGPSGAKYFAYSFADNVKQELILDVKLRGFYRAIKPKK